MRSAFAGLMLAALVLPALAETEIAGVVGVAPDDVLNVRKAPGVSQPIIGALSPFAFGIEVLERRKTWARIRRGEVEGWVAARHLGTAGPSELAGGLPPDPLICSGTEPFWSVRLEGEDAVYSTPEGAEPPAPITRRMHSANSTVVWSVSIGEKENHRAIIAQDRLCSDGMSDNHYDLSIALIRPDGAFLSGCCRRP